MRIEDVVAFGVLDQWAHIRQLQRLGRDLLRCVARSRGGQSDADD